MESPKRDEFDLFISYAHADDRSAHAGKVTALYEAIKADYLRVTGTPLRVFFDTDEIRSMDAWKARILTGLGQSKMMVAILSPSYFASAYCLKEWEIYVETELALALPGEGITPIYVVRHPAFETDPVEEQLRHWIKDLRSRQYIECCRSGPRGRRRSSGRTSAASWPICPARSPTGCTAPPSGTQRPTPCPRRASTSSAVATRCTRCSTTCSRARSARSRRCTASPASARACWRSPTPGATASAIPAGGS